MSGDLEQALTNSLRSAQLPDTDSAAVALAMRYARAIDAQPGSPDPLAELGHRYLAALGALGLTPAARGAKREGGDPNDAAGEALAGLRAEHGAVARAGRAPALHAVPS